MIYLGQIMRCCNADAQSFPLELPSVPQLAYYGANTPGEVYKFEEARDFVEYAKLRGVRVIPEFDGPRHAANGWQFGELEGMADSECSLTMTPQCVP